MYPHEMVWPGELLEFRNCGGVPDVCFASAQEPAQQPVMILEGRGTITFCSQLFPDDERRVMLARGRDSRRELCNLDRKVV